MKKIIVIFLMLMYGFSSSGMTINLHYCCGKLDDISFSAFKGKDCKMNSHVTKSGCCTNAKISAAPTTGEAATVKYVTTLKSYVAVPAAVEPSLLYARNWVATANRLARGAPVPISSVPIFIKNCVFRV